MFYCSCLGISVFLFAFCTLIKLGLFSMFFVFVGCWNWISYQTGLTKLFFFPCRSFGVFCLYSCFVVVLGAGMSACACACVCSLSGRGGWGVMYQSAVISLIRLTSSIYAFLPPSPFLSSSCVFFSLLLWFIVLIFFNVIRRLHAKKKKKKKTKSWSVILFFVHSPPPDYCGRAQTWNVTRELDSSFAEFENLSCFAEKSLTTVHHLIYSNLWPCGSSLNTPRCLILLYLPCFF